MKQTEHEMQCNLIQWCRYNEHRFPELGLFFAIPNGGHRNVIVASKMKREGVKAGVPDLCLPISDGEHNCLFIEMKSPGKKPTKKQAELHKRLKRYGNKIAVCDSVTAAINVLINYIVKRRKHVVGKPEGGSGDGCGVDSREPDLVGE